MTDNIEFDLIAEGNIEFKIPKSDKVAKSMTVFYNPKMKLNRDISVLLVKSLGRKLHVALPLAGSGIRAIRFLKECGDLIEQINVNDLNPEAFTLMNNNLSELGLKGDNFSHVNTFNKEARIFISQLERFDYIDIDPFGSPNFLLDLAIQKISRNGILAITATDTAALCGVYPNVCKRRYYATPCHNEQMQEIGLRILIRKVQMVAAQYEKYVRVLFSYSKDHYMRIFFEVKKGKDEATRDIDSHSSFFYNDKTCEFNLIGGDDFNQYGPIYTGPLCDEELVRKMLDFEMDKATRKLLELLMNESKFDPGFYDIHTLSEKYKLPLIKNEIIKERLKQKGFGFAISHILPTAIKTDGSLKVVLDILKQTLVSVNFD